MVISDSARSSTCFAETLAAFPVDFRTALVWAATFCASPISPNAALATPTAAVTLTRPPTGPTTPRVTPPNAFRPVLPVFCMSPWKPFADCD